MEGIFQTDTDSVDRRNPPGCAASLIPNTQSSIPNPGLKHSASLTSQPPASPSLSLLPIRIEVEIKRQDSSVQFLVYWIKALVALKDWLANLEGF